MKNPLLKFFLVFAVFGVPQALAVGSETASKHGDGSQGINHVELTDNMFVMNGEKSFFPHKAHSSKDTKNIYPLSKEQLKAGLNQFEMETRMIQAAEWNFELKEEVLKKHVNDLPTLFDSTGLLSKKQLKTREEIIHASFENAIRVCFYFNIYLNLKIILTFYFSDIRCGQHGFD